MSYLRTLVMASRGVQRRVRAGPTCPMPGCHRDTVTDGVYTLCERGHLCGQGEFFDATGIERRIYKLLADRF
jgi:hypothetical protein